MKAVNVFLGLLVAVLVAGSASAGDTPSAEGAEVWAQTSVDARRDYPGFNLAARYKVRGSANYVVVGDETLNTVDSTFNVALGGGDTVERHFMDTIHGGNWLPNQDMAWRLCEQAVVRIRELENEIGCFFDRNPDGSLHQKAFAGQTADRDRCRSWRHRSRCYCSRRRTRKKHHARHGT